MFAECLCDET